MSKYLQIQIPQACHENWDRMDAAQQGRFCNSCQKNVVDFTLMNDDDLVNFFRKNKSNVCGRFTSDQLNTDILIPAKKIPWLKYFFTITLPAFLISLKANAQTNTVKGKVACVETKQYTTLGEIQIETTKTIKGKITNEIGEPIPGASVMVKNTRQGVAADVNGNYSIKVWSPYTSLVFSAVGCRTTEIDCSSNIRDTISLKMETVALQGMVVGAFVTTKRKKKLFSTSVLPNRSLNTPHTFSIYPNPVTTNSQLNIKWKNNISSDQSIEIFNQTGNLLQKEVISTNKKSTQNSIQLKQLLPGAYVIKITDSKTRKSSAQQFIVE